VGQGGEMTQALYAHMNNKKIKKIKKDQISMSIKKEVESYVYRGVDDMHCI
jgi:hypothetical protein